MSLSPELWLWVGCMEDVWHAESQGSALSALQADRVKLVELLTGYQLAITGHEGYPKVRLLGLFQLRACCSRGNASGLRAVMKG